MASYSKPVFGFETAYDPNPTKAVLEQKLAVKREPVVKAMPRVSVTVIVPEYLFVGVEKESLDRNLVWFIDSIMGYGVV